MDLGGRSVALYGRFSPGVRERFQREIDRRGGAVARDLTRRSEILVVGALASSLIDSGALPARLQTARERGVLLQGERAFAARLNGAGPDPATAPLGAALGQTTLTRDDVAVLAAFDLVVLEGEACRFGDAGVLRTASELLGQGRSLSDVVRILSRARDLSPAGRHKLVLTKSGEAALEWDDGFTSLEGQGFLALDEAHASVEELFEAASLAEAHADLDKAAHLFDMCARADRRDAIALYNFANIRMRQGAFGEAALGFQKALARDRKLVEARYNLAQALEAGGKVEAATTELARVLTEDPAYADAVFNLAQLKMKAGEMGAAKALYERYLALEPPPDWAAKARKAITVCAAG